MGQESACSGGGADRHEFDSQIGKIPWQRAEGMKTHPSILAWRILWTEDPGGLQSTGSQRAGHG